MLRCVPEIHQWCRASSHWVHVRGVGGSAGAQAAPRDPQAPGARWEAGAHTRWPQFCGPLAKPVLSARPGRQTQQGAKAPDELSTGRGSEASVLGLERPIPSQTLQEGGALGQSGQ